MERHLDALGLEVAKAKEDAERKGKAYATAKALVQQRIAAAEKLQQQVEAAAAAQKPALEQSLETLLKLAEEQSREVDALKRDADEAASFSAQMQGAYQEAGAKLKNAKSELDHAQREMERARQERETAERQANAARIAAGLGGAPDSLSVATAAMSAAAEKDHEAAEAARAKAQNLAPSRPEIEDPNIAAAMAAAAGTPPAPASAADRLAALRAKHG